MTGDLKLFRRRWWGAWTIGGVALGTIVLCWWVTLDPLGNPRSTGLQPGLGTTIVLMPVFLICYAPWTFFNILRALALLVVVTCAWYLVGELRSGHYVTEPGESQSASNALHATIVFGVPALWLALMRRPQVCPYDLQGRPRPFEIERTVRLTLPAVEDSRAAKALLTIVRFDYAGPFRSEVVLPGSESVFRVTLPLDRTGEAVWFDWQRRLAEAGVPCEIVEEVPGRRSFLESMVQSVKGRRWFGRRVRLDATSPSSKP